MRTEPLYLQGESLSANDVYALQEAVLAANTARNPNLSFSAISEQNKKLETSTKTVIGAINELARRINAETSSNRRVIMSLLKLVGDPYLHDSLVRQVFSKSSSLTKLVLDMYRDFEKIQNQIHTTYYDPSVIDSKFKSNNYTFEKLSHTPIADTVKVYINSAIYIPSQGAFVVYPADRLVQWTGFQTATNEDGFTPSNGDSVLIEYLGLLKEED